MKRLQDHDEHVRRDILEAALSAAKEDPKVIVPSERSGSVVSALLKRTIDKKIKVRQVAVKGLAKLFELHVRPHWERNEPLPDGCRSFMHIPRRFMSNMSIVDLAGRYEVFCISNRPLISCDSLFRSEKRSFCLKRKIELQSRLIFIGWGFDISFTGGSPSQKTQCQHRRIYHFSDDGCRRQNETNERVAWMCGCT